MKRRIFWLVVSCLTAWSSWLAPVRAEVYYKGEWVKITDRVYHFQREVSSNSGAILMKDYAVIVDAGQEPESGKEVDDMKTRRVPIIRQGLSERLHWIPMDPQPRERIYRRSGEKAFKDYLNAKGHLPYATDSEREEAGR